MNYLTVETDDGETLLAVAGSENDAKSIVDTLERNRYGIFRIRGLTNLKNVKIPLGLQWIVESDRKHQERESNARLANMTDKNALSFKKPNDKEDVDNWENEGGAN